MKCDTLKIAILTKGYEYLEKSDNLIEYKLEKSDNLIEYKLAGRDHNPNRTSEDVPKVYKITKNNH